RWQSWHRGPVGDPRTGPTAAPAAGARNPGRHSPENETKRSAAAGGLPETGQQEASTVLLKKTGRFSSFSQSHRSARQQQQKRKTTEEKTEATASRSRAHRTGGKKAPQSVLRYSSSCHAIVRSPPSSRRCFLLLGLRLRLRQRHPAEWAGAEAPALGGRGVAPPDDLHLVAPPRGLLVHHEPPHQDVVRQRLAAEHAPRALTASAPRGERRQRRRRRRRRHQRAHAGAGAAPGR
uniref:Uncharacterized protein n=1 Tax=Zea mays TaxID=4577 RepID=A0A804UMP9_MAIZE